MPRYSSGVGSSLQVGLLIGIIIGCIVAASMGTIVAINRQVVLVVPPTTTTTTTSAPTPAPILPVPCPGSTYVQESPLTLRNIHRSAYNSDNQLLYVFADYGEGEMYHIAVGAYPTVPLVTSLNLIPAGGLLNLDGILAAVYNPTTGLFLISEDNNGMGTLTPDGTTFVSTGESIYCKDLVRNGITGKVWCTNNNDFFEVDPTTGARLGPDIDYIYDVAPSGNHIGADGRYASWDPITEAIYVAARTDSSDIGTSYLFKLNTTTGILTGTCLSEEMPLFTVGIDFDNLGRLWVLSGVKELQPHPNGLYVIDRAPFMPKTTDTPTFNLTCGVGIELPFGSSLPAPTHTITGTGCNGDIPKQSQVYFGAAFLEVTGGSGGGGGKKRDLSSTPATSVATHQTSNYNVSVVDACGMLLNSTLSMVNITGNATRKRSVLSNPYHGSIEYLYDSENYNELPFTTDARVQQVDGPSSSELGATLVSTVNFVLKQSSGATYDLTSATTPNCGTYTNQHQMFFDHVSNRWVVFWVPGSGSYLCAHISATPLMSGSWDSFEWPSPFGFISKLKLAHWGDYYQFCYNEGDLEVYGNCYVIERARMISPGLPPRMIALPKPDIITMDSKLATVTPISRPPNNGLMSPMRTAFPCGITASMTGDLGGVLNLVLCQSVDFDLPAVVTIQSMTSVGTYNSAVGTCASVDECVDIGSTGLLTLDPLRYEIAVAYRQFTDGERLAVAVGVDADGTAVPKIKWGEFIMNTNGTLTALGETETLHNYPKVASTRPHWRPGLAYMPTGALVMEMSRATYDDPGYMDYAFAYRTRGYGEGEMTDALAVNALVPFDKYLSLGSIRPIKGMDRGFIMGGTYTSTTPTRIIVSFFGYELTSHSGVEKVFAVDECNVTVTCTRTVTLATPPSFALPMFKK